MCAEPLFNADGIRVGAYDSATEVVKLGVKAFKPVGTCKCVSISLAPGFELCECSECGSPMMKSCSRFCPNCGAVVEGRTEAVRKDREKGAAKRDSLFKS